MTAPAPIPVVLADDHAIVRDGLRTLVNGTPDLTVVGEAGDGPGAVAAAREMGAGVAVVDLSMPGGGVRTITDLRAAAPGVRVLVLTMHDDPAYLRAALEAGADGYLLKSGPIDALLAGIRTVAAGGRAVAPGLDPVPAAPSVAARLAALSRREQEVLSLLARGHTNQRIADALLVSVKTVETYRLRIKEKTGLRNRAEFVRYAQLLGLDGFSQAELDDDPPAPSKP